MYIDRKNANERLDISSERFNEYTASIYVVIGARTIPVRALTDVAYGTGTDGGVILTG